MQDVQGEVAPPFGPLVVLLGQDRADQPGHRVPVGEDPHDDWDAMLDLRFPDAPPTPELAAR